jgi:GT2 family glycosyltransferase
MANEQMNNKKPSVSVIVPNLNQGHFLEQALQSIISQADLDIRIALMDAGSSDGSMAIIKKYESHLTYWRSQPDNGQAAAINEGVHKLPQSDYVCWLNADDVFLENGLTKMVKYMEEHSGCVSVYSKAYITDVNNTILSNYPTEKFSINGLSHQCFICQPATLIRSKAWVDINGVDPAFHMCMDYDLWWRLHKRGEIGYLDDFTACSRDHEGTKTRNNKEKHFVESFKLLKRHIGFVPFHWCVSMIRETKLKKEIPFPRLISRMIAVYVYLVNRI